MTHGPKSISVDFRVLYTFAGVKRHADVRDALLHHVDRANCDIADHGLPVVINLVLEEVYTQRGGLEHNLLDSGLQDSLVSGVVEG